MKPKYIIYLLLFCLFLVFLYLQRNTNEELCVKRQSDFNSDSFKGEVTKLFIDSTNHMYQSLLISTSNDTISRSLFGVNSMRELFSNTSPGDTIIKKEGENFICIKRKGEIVRYKVDLKCDG